MPKVARLIFGGENGVFALFLDAALLPFVG